MTSDAITDSKAALAHGEYLAAYEIALRGLKQEPGDAGLQHTVVLALARMGAHRQARKLYTEYGLADVREVDALALGARLEKDFALSQPSNERAPYYLIAAKAYEQIFQDFGRSDFYPAINAASLYALAGDDQQASELAAATVALCEQQPPSYWSLASLAEARLVLHDLDACKTALQQATAEAAADIANLAATRKQFQMLQAPDDVLALLDLPAIVHFAGHIIGAVDQPCRFPAEQEAEVAQNIQHMLEQHNVMIGYGSLAAGADVLFAEGILARGGEVNIVLPFDKADFIVTSVQTPGAAWESRFERCLEQAASVTYSSTGSYNGNDTLFHNCSLYAMGLACLRQSHLGAPLMQLLVWDGEQTKLAAGTADDRATWTELGYASHVIPVRSTKVDVASAAPASKTTKQSELSAVVFGDVAGFSKLTDREIPLFVEHVMGTLALALKQVLGEEEVSHMLSVNTWGDGIFMVFDDADLAARCAHLMLQTLADTDLQAVGIEQHPQLRIGANYGPVFQFKDPITGRLNFFGHQVNTAARIEPIAPQGEVYVTEAFAAQLALLPQRGFAADYVGEMQLAKNFGKSRMYLLKPTSD